MVLNRAAAGSPLRLGPPLQPRHPAPPRKGPGVTLFRRHRTRRLSAVLPGHIATPPLSLQCRTRSARRVCVPPLHHTHAPAGRAPPQGDHQAQHLGGGEPVVAYRVSITLPDAEIRASPLPPQGGGGGRGGTALASPARRWVLPGQTSCRSPAQRTARPRSRGLVTICAGDQPGGRHTARAHSRSGSLTSAVVHGPPRAKTLAAYTSHCTGTRLDLVECLSRATPGWCAAPRPWSNSKGRGPAGRIRRRCLGEAVLPAAPPPGMSFLTARTINARTTPAGTLRCASPGSASGVRTAP